MLFQDTTANARIILVVAAAMHVPRPSCFLVKSGGMLQDGMQMACLNIADRHVRGEGGLFRTALRRRPTKARFKHAL